MLLIYLPENSSRCRYVFDLIFKDEFGISFRTTIDAKEYEAFSGEKINYSLERTSK